MPTTIRIPVNRGSKYMKNDLLEFDFSPKGKARIRRANFYPTLNANVVCRENIVPGGIVVLDGGIDSERIYEARNMRP